MDALIALLKSNTDAAIAFGAIANAGAAFLALVVSTIAVAISIWGVCSQRKHNKLTVRPLAEITVADYEDSLRVKLLNNGTGPMIVTEVTVSNGSDVKQCVVDWMPALPNDRSWNNFTDDLRDRTLRPGGEIVLLELTEHEKEKGFSRCRDTVRQALAPLRVTVSYTDIYNQIMPSRVKDLSWFGRTM